MATANTNQLGQTYQGNAPACTVMLWQHFLEYPPLLHDYFSNGYDPKKVDHRVLDLTGMRGNMKIREFEVRNAEELLRLTQDLLGRLILFRAKMVHVRVEDRGKNNKKIYQWEDDFAVLVNLQHEELQSEIKAKLDAAMDYMIKHQKFCLEFSFEKRLLDWYSERVDGKRSEMEYINPVERSHAAYNLDLVIHNCSTPINCCLSLWTISLCFPLWLVLGGSCYYVYRKAFVTELRHSFDVSLKFRMTDTCPPEVTLKHFGLSVIRHMQTVGLSSRGLVDKMKCMDLVGYH